MHIDVFLLMPPTRPEEGNNQKDEKQTAQDQLGGGGAHKHEECTKQRALGGVCEGAMIKASGVMMLFCCACSSLQ